MTEPNKIFRSGCQEDPMYCDGSSSRNFKYRMNSLKKGVKFRSILKISVYILGFILIALSFIVVGVFLYPNLVGDCKRPTTLVEHESESQTNQHYVSILEEIFNGMGICKETNHKTVMDKKLRLNNNKTEIPEILNGSFLVGEECKCLNINENGTKTSELNRKCICNETHKTNEFQTRGMRNKSENYDANPLNTKNSSHSADFYFNETDTVYETQYFGKNECHCEKPHKIKDVNMNGTYSEVLNISECKCSEIIEDNLGINDTITENEQHDDKLLEIRKCQCPKVGGVILNVSESDEKFGVESKNINECFCPEIQEMDDANYRKTVNEDKKHDIVPMFITEAIDAINSHLSETDSGNERQYIKNECICPKPSRKNGAFFNGTLLNGTLLNDMHNGQFEIDDDCKCPELLEIDNFDLSKTGYKTEKNNKNYVKVSNLKCECSSTNNMTDDISNNSSARSHLNIGFKTEDGECICPETEETDGLSSRKTINDSTNSNMESLNKENVFNASNFHRNKTRTKNERKSLKKDKCVCPKAHQKFDIVYNGTRNKNEMRDTEFTAGDECICPEILEIDNFDLKGPLSKEKKGDSDFLNREHKCVCPRMNKMLNNGSIIKIKTFGTKTVYGNCVCPEILNTDKIHVNETRSIVTTGNENANEKELHNYEKETVTEEFAPVDVLETLNEKELNYDEADTVTENLANGDITETINEKGGKNGDKMETAYETELINGNETETLNGKEMRNDDETVNENQSYNDEKTEIADEKRLINSDETEKANEKEMMNGNETYTVDDKEMIEGDETESVKSKEMTNDDVTENINQN